MTLARIHFVRSTIGLLAVVALCLTPCSRAQVDAIPEPVPESAALPRAVQESAALPRPVFEALREAGIPPSGVALYAHELGANKPFLSHQAAQPMNPASVMKLLTTYSALELLGPAYTWRTELYGTGVSGAALRGDLYIKGYGDPKLTMEQFWLLLRNLRQRGIREIGGDLIIDNSHFELPAADPAAFDSQGQRAYNVLPRAVLPSFKAVSFRFVPDLDERIVRIYAEPDLKPLRIINKVALKTGACPFDWRESVERDLDNGAQSATVTFRGVFYTECGERDLGLSVLANGEFAAALFRQYWAELGGTFKGKVADGTVPAGARLLVSRQSPPLSELMRDINKWSNNVMARQLLLTMGAESGGAPGSVAKGEAAMRRWLVGKGLSFPELVIENGAGLSRIERLSAQHLGELLLSAAASPYAAELEASLPIAGIDGTLKRRLNERAVAGRAHIKTGSLEGVRAIAGYVLDAKGRKIIVVFLVNHSRAQGAQAAQDALLDWVYGRL
jgi:serine-type D-Ala-D-Ala carboxypeptidase/endopeptidase (penicillin-binding protein 4)